ncbi:MAG TPA: hypothetical protein VLA56_19525 [Pseudomonadales bacterium]|nr:hypothetical protein [Pseudomonadales bacterium]
MRVTWLLGDREGPPATWPPLLMLLGGATATLLAETLFAGGLAWELMTRRQVIGTLLMFITLPPYLVAMAGVVHRRAQAAVDALAPLSSADAAAEVREALTRLSHGALAMLLFGALFGLWQNRAFLQRILDGAAAMPIDAVFITGNAIVWAAVGLLLAIGVRTCRALSRFGGSLRLDLYDLAVLRPLARVSTGYVLLVAGAMVFMPLQSLDAQLRLQNYDVGIVVSVLAGSALFVLPLLGARARVAQLKALRLADLRGRLEATARTDVQDMELISAHMDRVRQIHAWPIDVQLVTRVFAYVIIPPLAWVAAAVVEGWVEAL